MTQLDGPTVRLARLNLGLSTRKAAALARISAIVWLRVERGDGTSVTAITLRQLDRIAEVLCVPPSSLLQDSDAPQPRPTAEPSDVAELGALLLHQVVNTSALDLADSLGWTLERLNETAEVLDRLVEPAGLRVHRLRGGLRLRPNTTERGRQVSTAADQLIAARTGLDEATAALLYRALQGSFGTQHFGAALRPKLARAVKMGLLELEQKEIVHPSEALLFAVDIDID